MKKHVTKLIIILICTFITSNTYAGAAICIATDKTPKNHQTDIDYFTHWGESDGYKMERIVRNVHKSKYRGTPTCRSTAKSNARYFMVIKNIKKNYDGENEIKFAFGFGESQREAEQDAIEELARRSWNWKKLDGYSVEALQEIPVTTSRSKYSQPYENHVIRKISNNPIPSIQKVKHKSQEIAQIKDISSFTRELMNITSRLQRKDIDKAEYCAIMHQLWANLNASGASSIEAIRPLFQSSISTLCKNQAKSTMVYRKFNHTPPPKLNILGAEIGNRDESMYKRYN